MKALMLMVLAWTTAIAAAQIEDPPLKTAARGGDLVAVERLLATGAAVDVLDTDGNTPLISAAYHDHADVLSALLHAGADSQHRNGDGYSALDYAMENGHRDVVLALLRFWQARLGTAAAESAQLATLIAVTECATATPIAATIDPNRANASGYTPLAMAARWGCRQGVEALLQQGARVDAVTDSRYRTSALMESTRDGHLDIARRLLAAGADVNLRDRHGDHALNWAAYFGQAELVELFLAHAADTSYTGQTPDNALAIATREGHQRVVDILKKAGATPLSPQGRQ